MKNESISEASTFCNTTTFLGLIGYGKMGVILNPCDIRSQNRRNETVDYESAMHNLKYWIILAGSNRVTFAQTGSRKISSNRVTFA